MKRLYIIGAGPGGREHLSPAAVEAIRSSTDLVGYGLYLDLLPDLTAGKNCHRSPLGDEIGRGRLALDLAAADQATALISSGDAGVYGMATVVYELLDRDPQQAWRGVEPLVVPGISAIQAVAARVGAPLSHDFCTISLSDLLTPWELIERRVLAAAQAEFVVAFYNPASRNRHWQLDRAMAILTRYRPGDTPVVVARDVTRDNEVVSVETLQFADLSSVDMRTLVLVGNSETRRVSRWIYTPRGYREPDGDVPGNGMER